MGKTELQKISMLVYLQNWCNMKKSRWSKITEKYKFYSFLSNACLRGNLSQRSRLIWFSVWHYGIITLRMWAEYYDINDNKGLDWYFHEHWCTGPDKIQYFPTMKILDDTKFWCRRPKILIVLHIEKILQNQKNVTHRVKKKLHFMLQVIQIANTRNTHSFLHTSEKL